MNFLPIHLKAPLNIGFGRERPLWNKGSRVAWIENIEWLEVPLRHCIAQFRHGVQGLLQTIGSAGNSLKNSWDGLCDWMSGL